LFSAYSQLACSGQAPQLGLTLLQNTCRYKPCRLCTANVIHKSTGKPYLHIARRTGLYPAARHSPCRLTVTLNDRALSDVNQPKPTPFMTKICRMRHIASRTRSSTTTESIDRATPPANAFATDSQGKVGCLDKLLCVCMCVSMLTTCAYSNCPSYA